MAFVAPYTLALDDPAKASRKLTVGSLIAVLPPRTTNPVIEMLYVCSQVLLDKIIGSSTEQVAYKIKVINFNNPMKFASRRDQRVLKTRTENLLSVYHQAITSSVSQDSHKTATVYDATATPFCCQSLGLEPPSLNRYSARTIGIC